MYFLQKYLAPLAVACVLFSPVDARAGGGISVQGTRLIYPLDARHLSLSVSNSSDTDAFLVQSWIENAGGQKTQDFVVTPPLYLSKPGNENMLRLVRTGGTLPKDRESLYYFIAKAIPSVSDTPAGKSVIRIAAATRLKLFVRPDGLKPARSEAPAKLTFHRSGRQVRIDNPTPYYLTLTDMKASGNALGGVMIPPASSAQTLLPTAAGSTLSFRTIGDYGAATEPVTVSLH